MCIDKDTKTLSFKSPTTDQDDEAQPDKDQRDDEFPKMIDRWDSLWQEESEVSANIFILDKINITIYEVTSFTYLTNEVFFPMNIEYVNNNLEKKLASVMIAQNLTKMLNSSLNLYTASILNPVFDLDFENEHFQNLIKPFLTKLKILAKDPIINEMSHNAFNKRPLTNQWQVFQKHFLEINDVELVQFFQTIRKTNEF